MAIKYGGWIDKFEGPESFDNAQPEIPEEELQRLDDAYNKVMGTRPKAKRNLPDDGQSNDGKRKAV